MKFINDVFCQILISNVRQKNCLGST